MNLIDYIVQQFDICDLPEARPFIIKLLEKGKAIILFDGLDEVNIRDYLRSSIIDQIVNFSNKYNKNKIVITCRVSAVEYLFERFKIVEMANFDNQQIVTFINKWFDNDQSIVNKIISQLEKNYRLKDLAQNPLLLTLLCLSFKDSFTFSDRRSEIYADAIDALLKRWDASRKIQRDEIYEMLTLGRKKQMLNRIAYKTYSRKQYTFRMLTLSKIIDNFISSLPIKDKDEYEAITIVKAMQSQHGIFVERAKNIYSFAHLTFQEYFTACYIIQNSRSRLIEILIENFFMDERWREVVFLVAEMLDNADDFFEYFICEFPKKFTSNNDPEEVLRYLSDLLDCLDIASVTNRKELSIRIQNVAKRPEYLLEGEYFE